MYPRAGAYIISVKQSTYCQFGEVIRAHTERVKREGEDCWVKRGRNKSRKDMRWLHILENNRGIDKDYMNTHKFLKH